MSEFWEKYKDPRWQRKRLERMEHADFTCEHCEATNKTLNVHHKLYRKGADPWDYTDLELMCLCEECHEEWHKAKANLGVSLQYMDLDDYREVVGYSVGIAVRRCSPEMAIPFRHKTGIRGVARALGITEVQIEKLRGDDGRIFVGDLQRLSAAARKGKKSAR